MILSLSLVTMGFYLPLQLSQAHATRPLGPLDGLGANTTCQAVDSVNNRNCDAQLLTTDHGHDAIILVAMCGCGAIASVIDSSGLIFIHRLSYSSSGSSLPVGDFLWEYWARASSPLKSDNITVVFSGGWMHGIQVFAVERPNLRQVFDPDPSIPATVTCTGSWSIGPTCGDCNASFNQGTCFASIRTSTPDFVVAGTALGDAPACGGQTGRVPGFTTVTTNNGFGGWFEVDYSVVPQPQRLVFNCNGTDAVAIMMDAISFR